MSSPVDYMLIEGVSKKVDLAVIELESIMVGDGVSLEQMYRILHPLYEASGVLDRLYANMNASQPTDAGKEQGE